MNVAQAQIDPLTRLNLPPGFRFYPSDEELMVQYLCRKVAGHHFSLPIIGEIDLYKFDPWVLPAKALFGEKEWYFFTPRDRKYPNGSRPNRVAGSGYWKATGTDKVIMSEGRQVGIKKALVFYIGKAPKGTKTNWIMHEYRLFQSSSKSGGSKLDDWVLCRIYKKSSSSSKSIEGFTSTEQSSSPTTSSSYLDDVMDSSFPAFPGMNSMGTNHEEHMEFGSDCFDWSMCGGLNDEATGLGQAQTQSHVVLPSLPPLYHVESPEEKFGHEITDRVNGSVGTFRQRYSGSVDPFAIRYVAPMVGYGFGQ